MTDIYTRYIYEKTWQKTSQKEALRMIEEEMPETDAQATMQYILAEIEKDKVVTLGECQFSSKAR